MTAAVRGMANGAILLHRRMLPDPGAALVGMTLVAELVVGFRIDHVLRERAMGIVAVGTVDLAFTDWMVRHLVDIGTYVPMAIKADLGLLHGRPRLVDPMTGDAGHVVFFVRAHVPEGQFGRFFVAVQALLGKFLRRTSATLGEGNYGLLGLVTKMLIR